MQLFRGSASRPHAAAVTTSNRRRATATAAARAAAADEHDPPLAPLSRRHSAVVYRDPTLLRTATLARSEIDRLFADPRKLETRRLLDPFVVENQYNLLRTQPGALLGDQATHTVVDALASFGERALGLRSITPPWISFYLDGMSQDVHVDGFQGPLAFVLPLSWWGDEEEEEDDVRRPRVFRGGETAILRQGVLRYWDGDEEEEEEALVAAGGSTTTIINLSGGAFAPCQGKELDHLFARVPPRFGRMLVFDGRLPHGVRPVRCPSSDPRDARIALHGWYAQPDAPFFFRGALADEEEGDKAPRASPAKRKAAAAAVDKALAALVSELADECPPATGLLTLRVNVSGETGRVVVGGGVEFLADTLVVSPTVCVDGGISEQEARALIQTVAAQRLAAIKFPTGVGGGSSLTVPLVFE